MYNLRKAESDHPVLQDFVKNLPFKPYSSDDLSFGLKISNAKRALKRSYIQSNPRDMIYRITIDVDHDNAVFAAYDANIVEPTFIVKNKYKNFGRAHLHYDLAVPVCRSDNANRHPIQYLAAIEAALIKALNGDPDYVGLVTKNPFSSDYECIVGEGKSYTLEELAECLELEQVQNKWRKKKREETRGHLGRNCDLFDDLRFWAYDRVSDARDSQSYPAWFDYAAAEAEKLNNFQTPLDARELNAIVKSVARWTWDKYTGQGSGCKRGRDTLKNSLLIDDRDKQILAAHETNKQRKTNTETNISNAIKALQLENKKITIASISKKSGIHRNTVSKNKHLLSVKSAQYGVHQDNSPLGESFHSLNIVNSSYGATASFACSKDPERSGSEVLEQSHTLLKLTLSMNEKFLGEDDTVINRALDVAIIHKVLLCVSKFNNDNKISKELVSEKTGFFVYEFERFWKNVCPDN